MAILDLDLGHNNNDSTTAPPCHAYAAPASDQHAGDGADADVPSHRHQADAQEEEEEEEEEEKLLLKGVRHLCERGGITRLPARYVLPPRPAAAAQPQRRRWRLPEPRHRPRPAPHPPGARHGAGRARRGVPGLRLLPGRRPRRRRRRRDARRGAPLLRPPLRRARALHVRRHPRPRAVRHQLQPAQRRRPLLAGLPQARLRRQPRRRRPVMAGRARRPQGGGVGVHGVVPASVQGADGGGAGGARDRRRRRRRGAGGLRRRVADADGELLPGVPGAGPHAGDAAALRLRLPHRPAAGPGQRTRGQARRQVGPRRPAPRRARRQRRRPLRDVQQRALQERAPPGPREPVSVAHLGGVAAQPATGEGDRAGAGAGGRRQEPAEVHGHRLRHLPRLPQLSRGQAHVLPPDQEAPHQLTSMTRGAHQPIDIPATSLNHPNRTRDATWIPIHLFPS